MGKEYFIKDAYLVSHPKCGRTWLKMLFAHIMKYEGYDHGVEFIRAEHWMEKFAPKDKKVIYLYRDPRDVVVSFYFDWTQRKKYPYPGTLSEFIRSDIGIDNIVRHMNGWSDSCLSVSYEDMHMLPMKVISDIFSFVGFSSSENSIDMAIKACRFDKMKRMEKKGNLIENWRGAFGKKSGKCRIGKVGGYVDYLTTKDIEYCNDAMWRLNKTYEYR